MHPELKRIVEFLREVIEKDMIPEKEKSGLFFNLLKDAYKYMSADEVTKMLTNEPITHYAWTAAGARRPRPPC